MELSVYVTILWRRKWVIAVTLAVTVAVVVAGTLAATPKYVASTTLRIATALGDSVDYGEYMYADRLTNTYVKIATSGPVLEELMERLGLDEPPQIKVEAVANTELMQITAEDPDPILAREAANTLAEILVAQSRELYSGGGKAAHEILGEQLAQVEDEFSRARREYESLVAGFPEGSQRLAAASRSISLKEQTYAALLEQYDQARVREAIRANAVSVVEPAVAPQAPSKPRRGLNIALGFVVGLAGGTGLAFLFENLDNTLYAAEQIRQVTQLPVIGKIPTVKRPQKSAFFDGNSPQAEAFRRLRTHISRPGGGGPPQTLLVTSAEPREGKSTVVANLALTIAQSGRKVIVVDADLRRPSLHRIFRMPNRLGLSSILRREVKLAEAVQERKIYPPQVYHLRDHVSWSRIWRRLDWFEVLTGGPLLPNPVEVLGSSKMTALIEQLKQQYDVVLFDTPALLAVTDAVVLAPVVDGVLLVVGRAQARREAVQAACQQLADVHARTIGVVVNRAEQERDHAYYRQTPARRDGRDPKKPRRVRSAMDRREIATRH